MRNHFTICAMSDLHGQLPNTNTLTPCNIVVICGDTVPLDYQRSTELTEDWFATEFREWVMRIPGKIFMIAGNHDFWMFKKGKEYVKQKFGEWFLGKVEYLEDELTEYDGVTIYGCPWCTGPMNWAFAPANKISHYGRKPITVLPYYDKIPECDVLLTHQPPCVGDLGTSFYWDPVRKMNWGSEELRKAIKDKNITLALCGHVHSGQHSRVEYPVPGCDTIFYNVSLLNECYELAYSPLYLTINADEKTVAEIKK